MVLLSQIRGFRVTSNSLSVPCLPHAHTFSFPPKGNTLKSFCITFPANTLTKSLTSLGWPLHFWKSVLMFQLPEALNFTFPPFILKDRWQMWCFVYILQFLKWAFLNFCIFPIILPISISLKSICFFFIWIQIIFSVHFVCRNVMSCSCLSLGGKAVQMMPVAVLELMSR